MFAWLIWSLVMLVLVQEKNRKMDKTMPEMGETISLIQKTRPEHEKTLPEHEKMEPEREKTLPEREKMEPEREKTLPKMSKTTGKRQATLPKKRKTNREAHKMLLERSSGESREQGWLTKASKPRCGGRWDGGGTMNHSFRQGVTH
jgi:hypothetical protein